MTGKLVKFNTYKHKTSKWITYGILKSIRFRDNLYKKLKLTNPVLREYDILYTNLQTYNKILKRSIREAKQRFLESTFNRYNRIEILGKLQMKSFRETTKPFHFLNPLTLTETK